MSFDELVATGPVVWTDPRMRALLDACVICIPDPDDIRQISSSAGIPPGELPFGALATGRVIWRKAFDYAASQLILRVLVNAAAAASPALHQRVEELRKSTPALPTQSAEAPAAHEYVGFSDGAKKERQIVTTEPTLLDVRFLALGVERAKSVCRLEATFDDAVSTGTGFRIGSQSILTNHHVVFDEERDDAPANAIQLFFNHELGLDGRPLKPIVIDGIVSRLVGDRSNDWAVVEAGERLPDDAPILSIAGPIVPVAVDDRVAIIQHPKGLPKKIALAHNIVRYVDDSVVQYWTDTEEGSSGSPVFNERWEVVALHHASVALGDVDAYGCRNQGLAIAKIDNLIKAAARS